MAHRRRAHYQTMQPALKMAQPMDIMQHHRNRMDCYLRDNLCIPINQIIIWFTINTVLIVDHFMNYPSECALFLCQ